MAAGISEFIKSLIINEPETKFWNNVLNKTSVIYVKYGTDEWQMVNDYFTDSGYITDYDIIKVERIQNPFTLASFIMNRKKLMALNPKLPVQTRTLFHATGYRATRAIINENFNWRLSGKMRGHKYGQGTCFSPYSDFATQFGHPSREKYYILMCHVLQRKTMVGNHNTFIPLGDCDTTTSADGNVIVKYHDDTAYPAYRITYVERDDYDDDDYEDYEDDYYDYNYDYNYYMDSWQ